jgi:folate-dependent phosphoribosylglycinamide formyltransferase PurN
MLIDPLRLAILCSKRAPGLEELFAHPLRGKLFDVDRIVTSSDFESEKVRVIAHPMRKGVPRQDHDARTASLLGGADAVLLLGYLYVLTEPMLDAFPGRIFNIHDADLRLRNAEGGPRYPGLHSTRDAIAAGERQTRSSMHVVTAELDGGPVIARSKSFPVAPFIRAAAAAGARDIVSAYAYAQREWMMRSSWGALAVSGLAAHRPLRRLSKGVPDVRGGESLFASNEVPFLARRIV